MPKYKICYVDADTLLYRAAKSCQTDYIAVTHIATGATKRFKGVSEFYGLGKSKNKGWIGETNAKREAEGKPALTVDDFTIEQCAEVSGNHEEVLAIALESIDRGVGRIKKYSEAEDYKLCLGDGGNFRYDVAHILPYKGNRTDKPLLFLELKELMVNKYKSKIILVKDQEVDDYLGIVGFTNYQNFLKTKKWENILSFIDKDLRMILSPSFNYDKCEDGISIPTPEEAARYFCCQLLSGDKTTDNIQGLPNFSDDFRAKHNLGKTRGIGKATALNVLEGKSIKEMFEFVVDAYKCYYGEEKKPFTSFRGEEFYWNYLDYLKENAILLWMRRFENEMYDITTTLDRLKIKY
mgnify:CR=1 FL=1